MCLYNCVCDCVCVSMCAFFEAVVHAEQKLFNLYTFQLTHLTAVPQDIRVKSVEHWAFVEMAVMLMLMDTCMLVSLFLAQQEIVEVTMT